MREKLDENQLDNALDAMIGRGPKSLQELMESYPANSGLHFLVDAARVAGRAVPAQMSPDVKSAHITMIMEKARSGIGQQRVVSLNGSSRSRALFGRVVRPSPAFARARRLSYALIAIAAFMVPTAAMANEAVPGDGLHGVDLAVEKFRLALETSTEGDVELHLEFAAERLDEISVLMAEGKTALVGEVMSNFEGHADSAEDGLAELRALGSVTSELSSHLAEVLAKHVVVLQGLANESGCDPSDPSAGEDRCKGLLNALAKSQQVLLKNPHLSGIFPGRGRDLEEQGKPESPGKPESLPTSSSTDEPRSQRPAGAGNR